MTTAYPGALDALTNPTAADPLHSPSHSAQHANANDAIEAIQAELGVAPSGAYATVAARFTAEVAAPVTAHGTVGATETVSAATGLHTLTLDEALTLTWADLAAGRSWVLDFTQDGSGGNSITWPAGIKWAGGTPTLPTTAAARFVVQCYATGATDASVVGVYVGALS
ncbi:MAG: hypothetical protein IPM45_18090 [Acidimicrobiales bacterium]|nr:hypothetical protein [Acidimicrobiales bacterium]